MVYQITLNNFPWIDKGRHHHYENPRKIKMRNKRPAKYHPLLYISAIVF